MVPSGGGAVKRGRGRPPGTRNKATLMAQAKLLTQQQSKVKPATDGPKGRPLPVSSTNRVTACTSTTRSQRQSCSDSPCCLWRGCSEVDARVIDMGKISDHNFSHAGSSFTILLQFFFQREQNWPKYQKTNFKCAVLQNIGTSKA